MAWEKLAEDGPSPWAHAIHIENPGEIPDSWLQSGIALAIVATSGMTSR